MVFTSCGVVSCGRVTGSRGKDGLEGVDVVSIGVVTGILLTFCPDFVVSDGVGSYQWVTSLFGGNGRVQLITDVMAVCTGDLLSGIMLDGNCSETRSLSGDENTVVTPSSCVVDLSPTSFTCLSCTSGIRLCRTVKNILRNVVLSVLKSACAQWKANGYLLSCNESCSRLKCKGQTTVSSIT